MVELYFLIYRIPKMMSRLARERNRSALVWSLLGIGAWIGAELTVFLTFGIIYGVGIAFWGWQEEIPASVRFISYIVALAAAIGSFTLVRHILYSKSSDRSVLLPPPPPRF